MPRLRVLAGTSTSSLVPMTSYVNTDKAQHISSDLFDGHIAVHIKGFKDESGNVRTSEYFERDDRKDITWSVQVQGGVHSILFCGGSANPLGIVQAGSCKLTLQTIFYLATRLIDH
jgi:hypothetical protein